MNLSKEIRKITDARFIFSSGIMPEDWKKFVSEYGNNLFLIKPINVEIIKIFADGFKL